MSSTLNVPSDLSPPERRRQLEALLRKKAQRSRSFPLSFAQQRLWLLEQLDPGNPVYNIPMALRLYGAVDVEVLNRTLNAVAARHETLRTRIAVIDDQPAQVVEPVTPQMLAMVDLQDVDSEQREAEALARATAEARRPFRLDEGPLWRALLLRLSPTEHILTVVVHHAICDDWSMGVLFYELAELYRAFSAAQPSPLPDLPIQYADFAVWQRGQLQGETLERLLDYWRRRLQGLANLELPSDRPRPLHVVYAGATISRVFPAALANQLKELGRREGATLYMTLLAAFQVLLYRYSGQEDFAVGSPIAARVRKDTEGLIGFLANTLVMRADMGGNPAFREVLRRVRQTALEAYQHQEMPFEQLVGAINPPRDTSRHPLFQNLFTLQTAPWPNVRLANLTLAHVPLDSGTAKFDLWLSMRETEAGLAADVEYNVELFDALTIERMLGHLAMLLQAIVADPDRPIARLPLLTEAEQRQILVEWNDTAKDYQSSDCLHQLVEAQAARTPEAVAVVFEGQPLTFDGLNRKANQLARYLARYGVGPDTPVGMCLERSVELVVSLLAILKAGGAYLPLDPDYPPERLGFMLRDSRPAVVLTTRALGARLPADEVSLVSLEEVAEDVAREDSANLPLRNRWDDVAYVIYTSGSTGKPKGVRNTHRGICNRLLWMQDAYRLTPDDRVLQKTPFSFDVSVWEFFWPLLTGARLVVARPGGHKDPRYLARLVVEQQITTLHFVPSMLAVFLEDEEAGGCRSLRQVMCSGEALPYDVQQRFFSCLDAELHNLYGPTEAAVDVTYWHCRPNEARIVPIGKPIANMQCYILDSHRNVVPVGCPGELHLAGVGLARDYLNRPELTAEKFVAHPFSSHPDARLYRTGDLCRWLPDGNIEFLGRLDFQVKVRGVRIELGEIEDALGKHPAVRQAVVTAWDDGSGDKKLIAYWVAHDAGTAEAGQLREFLQASLPEAMIPAVFMRLETVPLNANGKVDRKALPRPDRQPDSPCPYVPPRTPDEEQLADIWSEVLRVDRVGIHDNFFALGGHSLRAAQVVSRIARRMDVDLPLRDMFQTPTVAELAERIALARTHGTVSRRGHIPVVPRDGLLPLSFTQEALWFLDQLDRGRPTYTVYPTLRLKGPLDVAVIERAFNEILRRHEALRTRFPEVDGRPVQIIDPPAFRPLTVVDLSGLPEEERQVAVTQRLLEETLRPVDLQVGPLLRVMLLKLSANEHMLLSAAHHIVFDGWTLGILSRELTALYAAFRGGRPSPLPDLTIQYADFAAWQRQYLQGETLDRLRSYWVEQLAGLPTLDLPLDLPRPAVRTSTGEQVQCQVSPQLSAAVRAFCRREGITPFMALLAVFQILLQRYTGQDDFAIGSPVANRMHPETEPIVGYFINMLVLRADLSGDPSFHDLAARVRHTALTAFEHQELTLDRVVEAVKSPRDPSRHPLFAAMFVLQNNDPPSLEQLGLEIEWPEDDPARRSALFELNLALWETEQGFSGTLNFNSDLFRIDTVERMTAHFLRLLEQVIAAPERPLSAVPLISEEERRKLLVEWNPPGGEPSCGDCVHELFAAQVARTPDAVALVDGPRQWSYAELDRSANQLAHYLQARGVGPEAVVAVRLPRSAEWVVALLGVLKAGGAYLPLDPALPPERLRFILEDARVEVLVTGQDFQGDLPEGLPHVIRLDADQAAIAGYPVDRAACQVAGGHLAYLIYTSGSTGRPKGVMIEQRALANYSQAAAAEYGIAAGERVLQFASGSFDAHVEEVYPCLTRGGTLLLRSDEMLDCKRFLELCHEWHLTFVTLPTSFWHELVAAIDAEGLAVPAALRMVVIGGERAAPERVAAWFRCVGSRVRLLNTYGPTETTVVATAAELSGADGRVERVPIGRPLSNTRVYVLDRHAQPVPIGARGELYVGGRSVARGYWNRPELSALAFLPDPYGEEPGARMYKTGDVVRWRPDGRLEFVGRTDQQVKIRGFRVEPAEVEQILREHPMLDEAVVVAVEHAPGEPRLVAYVVGHDGAPPTAAEMRRFLAQRLPAFMIPATWMVLDALPTMVSGKVDLQALPKPNWEHSSREGEFVAPRTATERQLAALWADMLSHGEAIGIDDNFFDLGGQSLLAIRLMSKIRETFSVDLPMVALFTAPRLADLAERILALQASGPVAKAPPILPALRRGPVPMSLNQEAFWVPYLLYPGVPLYYLHAALPVWGDLNVDVLRQTIEEVVRRHEALRTSFAVAEDGRPVQVIAPELRLELPVEDLPVDHRDELIHSLSQAQASEVFDLCKGPLFRIRLLRFGPTDHVLLVTVHHIIGDGWSVQVLAGEVLQLYDAFSSGRPSPLPALPIQYADYALWQREYLQGEVLDALMGYWREKLAGVASPALPADRPWRAEASHLRSERTFRVSAETRARLERICRSEKVTMFMLLLTAYQVLLQRYGGSDDVAVAVPVANRNRRETQGLIGLFINTLVLRSDFRGDCSFREALVRVRQTVLEGLDHQDLPIEMMIRELHLDDQPLRFPLTHVFFNYHQPVSTERVSWRYPVELGYRPTDMNPPLTRFDLELTFTEVSHGLDGVLQYDSTLFDPQTIERIEGHLQRLLEAVTADPDQRLSQLPLVGDGERRQVLVEWNRTGAGEVPQVCASQLIEAQVARTPDASAVVWGEEVLTYCELDARANRLGRYLQSLGVRPGERVGIHLERSAGMLVALLAVLKAGAAYVPLDLAYPRQRLAQMIDDSELRLVLSESSLRDALPAEGVPVVLLDALAEQFDRQSGEPLAPCAGGDDLAYILYTSGSTGAPKGVMIPHRSLVNFLTAPDVARMVRSGDTVLATSTISFDISITELFLPLTVGAAVLIVPREIVREGARLAELMRRHRVNVMQATPSTFRMLLGSGWQPAADLTIISGGEVLDDDLARRLLTAGGRLWNSYGPTETTVWCVMHMVTSPQGNIPIGRPIANIQLYVMDAHGSPAPIGVAGELWVGGAGLARGYWGRPELTAQRFVPNPLDSGSSAPLYRTGDLVRWLADGNLEFLGRVDGQVKIRGNRVELGEIEAALRTHPLVHQAAAALREAAPGEHRLTAYVVAEQRQTIPVDELRRFLRQTLPDFMIPAAFVFLDALPMTASGKLDRRALPAPAAVRPEVATAFVAPQDETQRQLAELWEELLAVHPVGSEDSFFDLGGHSLLAAQLVWRINARFASALSVADLYLHPTIAALVPLLLPAADRRGDDEPPSAERTSQFASRGEEIEADQKVTPPHASPGRTAKPSLVTLRAGGSARPLFCIHGLGGHVAALVPLARQLAAGRPVFGLQAQGLAAGAEPHDRVEAMAEFYFREIRALQAHGPYHLAGWSLGGLVALELAQQIHAAGEETGLLAMLDSEFLATVGVASDGDERLLLEWLARHLGLSPAALHKLPPELQQRRIAEKAESLGIAAGEIERLAATCKAHLAAGRRYRPRPYPGPAVLFRAGNGRGRLDGRWKTQFPALEVQWVAGNHYSMLQKPHVDELAAGLDRYLARLE